MILELSKAIAFRRAAEKKGTYYSYVLVDGGRFAFIYPTNPFAGKSIWDVLLKRGPKQ